MDEFKVRMSGLPVGLVSALMVTLILFIALPLLTQFQPSNKAREKAKGVLLSTKRPPPPPPENRDEPKEQEMKERKVEQKAKQKQRMRPQMKMPKFAMGGAGGGVGTVKIAMKTDFNISDSLFMSAFNAHEVDQPPRILRSFPPQYPFLAKRDGIEGRVILRIVVNAAGEAEEAEVDKAEPPEVEETFADAALKTVKRYKFKPAMKGGKAVNCIVKIPIAFTME